MELDSDPTGLDDGRLADLIGALVEEERRLSARRTSLHLRIDFLRGGGYAHLDASVDQLRDLEAEEHALSDARRHVHVLLDRARAEHHARVARTVAG